jgi:hypothetical protein
VFVAVHRFLWNIFYFDKDLVSITCDECRCPYRPSFKVVIKTVYSRCKLSGLRVKLHNTKCDENPFSSAWDFHTCRWIELP